MEINNLNFNKLEIQITTANVHLKVKEASSLDLAIFQMIKTLPSKL